VARVQSGQAAIDRTGRLDHGAARVDRDQERDAACGKRLARAAREAPFHQLRGQPAGRLGIDVRIGAVGRHRIGQIEHLLRHVGMQVEAGDDRQARPDQRAQPRQQLTLCIVDVFGHRGAMEVEVDGVQSRPGQCAARRLDDGAHDAFEGLARHLGRGRGAGPAGGQKLPAACPRLGDEAARRQAGAGEALQHRRPFRIGGEAVAALKGGPVGTCRSEGVGFVLEAGDQDIHRFIVSCERLRRPA
jgi:hypothetical protein